MEPAATDSRTRTDRRRRSRFVLGERRSGFDRRRRPRRTSMAAALDASLVHLRDNPRSLIDVLALANLLSLLDLTLTLMLFRLGAIEANPIMGYFFAAGTLQAAAFKCGLLGAASLGIWALRGRRAALLAALLFLAAYGAVVLYELAVLARLA
jgi:hypothetical protein